LLTGCKSEPNFTDNGNPGQIKAIVFYDDNKNGIMDSNESGVSQARVALSRRISCPPDDTPSYIAGDSSGVILFKDLKPGKYCVFPEGQFLTFKFTEEVYVSSDAVSTVMFGIARTP
jgi:uncharacterized protein (DUF2141 family)